MPFALSAGQATLIAQNVAHALPPRLCFIQSSVAIESSSDGTTWAALTGANTTGVNCAATWVRCTTSGGATVMVKRY